MDLLLRRLTTARMPCTADASRIAQSSVFHIKPPADACGVCGGNSSSCSGCDHVPNSGLEFDACGVCGGNGACLGCDMVPNSGKVADVCGVCEGNGDSCRGCDGVPRPDGGVKADSCGNCGGRDDSCSRPPSMGILPSIHGYACAGDEKAFSHPNCFSRAPCIFATFKRVL